MNQVRKCGLVCAVAAALAVGLTGTTSAVGAENVRSQQWYLDAMKVDTLWQKATGEGIKVAVIDSGVNPATPSLTGQVLKGADFTDTPGDETDDYDGHGTTMAELIAGTGKGGGLQGLAPQAKIIPMRVVTADLKVKKVNEWSIPDAIRAAADSDAKIISMSIGNEFSDPKEEAAVKYAQSKGKLLFAAAGNTGNRDNKPEYPAMYPEVVGVSASSAEGKIDDYSQHGEVVDLAAPGSGIPGWCDATFTRYCDRNGTSAATAVASASAALIWSANPDWTANQVLRVMFESAGKGADGKAEGISRYYGHGVVRPGAHLNRGLGKPGDPDISPLTNKKTGGAASAEPSDGSASSPPEDGGKAGDQPQAGEKPAAGQKAAAEDDGGQTGLIIGGAAAVVVVAGGVLFAVRRRRSA